MKPSVPNQQFLEAVPKTPWVGEFLDAWDDGERRFFLLEWSRRHRKTTVALNMLIRDCIEHAKWVSLVVGPFLKQIREIIWDDPKMLFNWLPPQTSVNWTKNEVKLLVTFPNGSILRLMGADKMERGRGIDCNDLFLDEFSYCKPDIWNTTFMPIMAGVSDIPRKTIFGYTPVGENHATDLFDWSMMRAEGHSLPTQGAATILRPQWWSSRVTNDSTKFLDPEFLKTCLAKWPRSLYDQEINCARVTVEEMTLITTEMLAQLNQRLAGVVPDFAEDRRIVSIDPAFGGDICKLMGFENGQIKTEESIREKHNTAEIVMAGKLMAQRIGTKNFVVDAIGNGLGVADGLAIDAAGYHVQYFQSSETATEKEDTEEMLQFANRRAEAYYYTSERIRHFEIQPILSANLIRGLPLATRYTVVGKGKMLIQPKLKIKEWLGRSPDDEDCYVMGQWGLQNVEPENQPPAHLRRAMRRPRNAMA